ncbi:MAG: nucleoside-diphosphate kinase, partial [Desulfobacterales bacterium]
MEKTLSIIKPDGVARGLIGEVINRLESNGLKIIAMKMLKMAKDQAESFYAVHKERPFFQSLTYFMTSGPIVVMVLEGEGAIARY